MVQKLYLGFRRHEDEREINNLKKDAEHYSKILVTIYQVTCHHVAKDHNLLPVKYLIPESLQCV
jgi:hypothetical protein